MDNLKGLKKKELLAICLKLGFRCKSKTSAQLISLITDGVQANKGSLAGGSNAPLNGRNFENATAVATCGTKLLQREFVNYMRELHVHVFRVPDESYVISLNITVVKILEKKTQSVEGSVETKLWAAPSLKREYELVLGDKFRISYALCVNAFLKRKLTSTKGKYLILAKILAEK